MFSRFVSASRRSVRPFQQQRFAGAIIDGKATAKSIRDGLKGRVASFKDKHGRVPGLAVVLIGNRPDSAAYVRNKIRSTKNAGMISKAEYFEEEVTKAEMLAVVDKLNNDPEIDGILVQLPLPGHLSKDSDDIIEKISPAKDVDGLSLLNVGHLMHYGDAPLKACTPAGCIRLLKNLPNYSLTGKDAVVIGRSNIVGKPIAQLLITENCTVTVCHSKTKNLADVVRRADVVVAAIGRAEFVKGDWVKPGAVVIDVGINKVDDKLVGDVDYAGAKENASHITPVPGGVGPMTIAMLLENTLIAAKQREGEAL